jgi:signal transduction histidine kinase
MLGPIDSLFSTDNFMPHGHCYQWNPTLIWLNVISDGITALSYTSIPFTLVYFARKRPDLPFRWMFWCFGLFIVACGATHYLDIWTLWTPTYWLAAVVKAITALASLPTAYLLVKLLPRALSIPTPETLRAANEQLRATTDDLRSSQSMLEVRIEQRTAALRHANEVLTQEIAERRQAESALRISEQKLRHAQKMEAVGRLAGGIAHDFNNLLSVVLSYSDMLLQTAGPDHPMHGELKQIQSAGLRAESLTHQLLAFSRQQVLQPKPVLLNDVVQSIEKMLTRLIGEHIELVTSLEPTLGLVHVDPGQIEQVIVNLVVNARDAMPKGGRVVISTANAPSEDGANTEIVLTVSDEGTGMDGGTLEHIYEPFFTTKDVGQGTGLGLATVLGIIEQSGGRIAVESAVDKGTTFFIRFAEMKGSAQNPSVDVATTNLPTGTETILVVEDEAMVRDLVVEILRRQGYTMLSAASGHDALAICASVTQPIDMLISDVIMPVMDGRELAERIAAAYPKIRVLLMSGYPNDVLDPRGVIEQGIPFLRKPIQPRALAIRVREVLDAPHPVTTSASPEEKIGNKV